MKNRIFALTLTFILVFSVGVFAGEWESFIDTPEVEYDVNEGSVKYSISPVENLLNGSVRQNLNFKYGIYKDTTISSNFSYKSKNSFGIGGSAKHKLEIKDMEMAFRSFGSYNNFVDNYIENNIEGDIYIVGLGKIVKRNINDKINIFSDTSIKYIKMTTTFNNVDFTTDSVYTTNDSVAEYKINPKQAVRVKLSSKLIDSDFKNIDFGLASAYNFKVTDNLTYTLNVANDLAKTNNNTEITNELETELPYDVTVNSSFTYNTSADNSVKLNAKKDMFEQFNVSGKYYKNLADNGYQSFTTGIGYNF